MPCSNWEVQNRLRREYWLDWESFRGIQLPWIHEDELGMCPLTFLFCQWTIAKLVKFLLFSYFFPPTLHTHFKSLDCISLGIMVCHADPWFRTGVMFLDLWHGCVFFILCTTLFFQKKLRSFGVSSATCWGAVLGFVCQKWIEGPPVGLHCGFSWMPFTTFACASVWACFDWRNDWFFFFFLIFGL